MEVHLSPERWRQIAVANFDRYVTKRMIEPNFVVNEEGIDDQDLCNFAKQIECDPKNLRAAVANSCARISREHLVIPISDEDEKAIMKSTAKLHLKEISVSLINYKREFGRVVHELNHNNIGLHITVEEMKAFVGPLHQEVITEFYFL